MIIGMWVIELNNGIRNEWMDARFKYRVAGATIVTTHATQLYSN